MDKLIEELEAAPEGTRELDAKIWALTCCPSDFNEYGLDEGVEPRFEPLEDGSVNYYAYRASPEVWNRLARRPSPEFSTSLDAAMTLVPKGLYGKIGFAPNRANARIWLGGKPAVNASIKVPQAALALCIVALKARQEMEPA